MPTLTLTPAPTLTRSSPRIKVVPGQVPEYSLDSHFMNSRLLPTIPMLCLAVSQTFAANPSGTGPEAAAVSAKMFTVCDGLEVTLFASEPMVRNPTDIDIDERGRVWVTEGVNYRSTFQKWGVLQPEGDRIVVLEDTKGTGHADKETVFYQDPSINAALGICVLGNKVIV